MMATSSKMSKTGEDTSSWDWLVRGLRIVLNEFELDLSQVGSQSRMRYEDFELIFYHIFLVYDPIETKRRFRSVCAARNPDERSKFFELAARYINDKQLAGQRVVATSQLRILGGEPFRRLLDNLIKSACDAKLERRRKDRPPLQSDEGEEKLADLLAPGLTQGQHNMLLAQKLRDKMDQVKSDIAKIRERQEELKQLRLQKADINKDVRDQWTELTRRNYQAQQHLNGHSILVKDAASSIGSSASHSSGGPPQAGDIQAMVRCLLSRLEASNAKSKVALERIQAMELPHEIDSAKKKDGQTSEKKRLSHFIREARKKFDTSQELDHSATDSPEENQKKLNEKYRQHLVEYDDGVDRLLKLWREEEEKLDEEMLEDPEVRCRFEELESLFPILKLTPIGAPEEEFENARNQTATKLPRLGLDFIKEFLDAYPDDRYDDKEILEASKSLFK